MAGVSVRTLHHYDAIGLLVPSGRSAAWYRLYTDDDLLRLQQILIDRELGLPLEEIRRSLDDPRFDRKNALLNQREQLKTRAQQIEAMIRSLDRALGALEHAFGNGEWNMEKIFEGFNPADYADEARNRWRDSEAFLEAEARTSRYSPEDWNAMKAEQGALYDAAFQALQEGRKPSDPSVMDIAERHRRFIDRWFYACSGAMHRNLASIYEDDHRFRRNIDRYGAGLTSFLAAAIRANASRLRD
jgi:DNA-binding transcriptional MerR regulator